MNSEQMEEFKQITRSHHAKVTITLTRDQVKAILMAVCQRENTMKSIIKNHPNDNTNEKQTLAFLKRIEHKLFKEIGL